MLTSSTADFGLHCCHGNGIVHALARIACSFLLLYRVSELFCAEAKQLLSSDTHLESSAAGLFGLFVFVSDVIHMFKHV